METFHAKLEGRHKINRLRDALSALVAAEQVLIPFDCDAFSRRALYGLLDVVEEVRQDHNPKLAVAGIVVNAFQPRAKLPQLSAALRKKARGATKATASKAAGK